MYENQTLQLRDQYGGGLYSTTLPNLTNPVVWRALTVQEFLEYDELIRGQVYPLAYIEDEIFKKCVKDKWLVDNRSILTAGTVSAVSATIMAFSGPGTAEEIEQALIISRNRAGGVIHQLASLITQGFPSYKPEEVYAMDFATFMLRAAQAESKLLSMGLIQKPVQIMGPEQQQPNKPTSRRDLLNEWQEKRRRVPQVPTPVQPPPPAPGPTLDRTIITNDDIMEHSAASDPSMDMTFIGKAVKETAALYPEYINQMKRGEKVSVPSVEERLAAAKQRVRNNEARTKERQQKLFDDGKKEMKELLEVRAQERKRKAARSKRRGR